MDILLSDSDTYNLIQRNPINKLIEDYKKILKRWSQNNYISDYIHFQLKSTNAILPKAYGLPKIHKNGYLLRIIISSTENPLHNFATFWQKILLKQVFPHNVVIIKICCASA